MPVILRTLSGKVTHYVLTAEEYYALGGKELNANLEKDLALLKQYMEKGSSRLLAWRQVRNMTQYEVASRIGGSQSMLSAFENKGPLKGSKYISKLATVYGITIDVLLGD
jgi:predicted transcriptional regulator